jgi:PAS domain S-box-containing protein
MTRTRTLTGKERTFAKHEVIVSKTNTRGIITYANDVFLTIADYRLEEILGKPHNILRHPDMPKIVYKLLWDRIHQGQEIFAYVVNRTKYGDHYWVFAHVTPSFDAAKNIIGAHSNRRSPNPEAIQVIAPIYALLKQEEAQHALAKDGMAASMKLLEATLAKQGVCYDEFILSL